MGTETSARDPQARLDSRSLTFRQPGKDLGMRGSGSFQRDRFDRGRGFTFDCTVNLKNGAARASYRWSSASSGGGYDDPGYAAPPAYRPPPSGSWGGSNSTAYPPSGRVFFTGGIINRASGKGLDVQDRSTRDAANVQQWSCSGQPNQQWKLGNR